MTNKYIHKPTVIEAIQWNGTNYDKIWEFIYPAYASGLDRKNNMFSLHTIERDYYVVEGDYIIRGIDGEPYPCKSSVFEENYDLV